MRRVALLLVVAAVLGLSATSANAVPRHVHNLATSSGQSHPIAGGVSLHAPCTAFLNFHNNVHLDVFAAGKNPHSLTPTFIAGEC
jgi:hypothetical protein